MALRCVKYLRGITLNQGYMMKANVRTQSHFAFFFGAVLLPGCLRIAGLCESCAQECKLKGLAIGCKFCAPPPIINMTNQLNLDPLGV